TANGSAQFELVTGTNILHKIWGNLAFIHVFHGQSKQCIFRRRGDRIAALRLVAILGSQSNIDVLAWQVPAPTCHLQNQALYTNCPPANATYYTPLPLQPRDS